MFRLAQQVGRAHLRVGGVICDDKDFGRPGEQIDTNLAIKLPLRFGDIGVPRADQHIDALERFCAERHRRDRLYAAEHIDLVGAREMHRRDRLRVRPALVRRRAGRDMTDARDLCRHDRHMRRRNHRIPPGRHITADLPDRNVAMAEDDARQGLDLDVLHGLTLDLGKVADLLLREFDVVDRLRRHLCDECADLVTRQPEPRGRPFVEAL